LISEPLNEKDMKNTDSIRVAALDTSEDNISKMHDVAFITVLLSTCNSTCIGVWPHADDSGLSVDCVGSLELLAPLALGSAGNDIFLDCRFVSRSDRKCLLVLLDQDQSQVSIKFDHRVKKETDRSNISTRIGLLKPICIFCLLPIFALGSRSFTKAINKYLKKKKKKKNK
jgi:hypothetical protein